MRNECIFCVGGADFEGASKIRNKSYLQGQQQTQTSVPVQRLELSDVLKNPKNQTNQKKKKPPTKQKPTPKPPQNNHIYKTLWKLLNYTLHVYEKMYDQMHKHTITTLSKGTVKYREQHVA